MVKALVVTFLVFVLSACWLYFAWARGERTNDWIVTDAKSLGITKARRDELSDIEWATRVEYAMNGKVYQGVVFEYLLGEQVIVYVNPDDPTEVVGKTGASGQMTLAPLLITVASGLFGIVLLLVKLSPKDDSEPSGDE